MNHSIDDLLSRHYKALQEPDQQRRDQLISDIVGSVIAKSPLGEHNVQLDETTVIACGDRQKSLLENRRPKRALTAWRSIMKRSIARAAVTLLVIVSLFSSVILLNDDSSNTSWAAMVDVLRDVKSAKYRYVIEIPDRKPSAGVTMVLEPYWFRDGGDDGFVRIVDSKIGKILNLQTDGKVATVVTLADMSQDAGSKGFFHSIRQDLLNPKKNPNIQREALGKKTIGGRDAIGYRITSLERTTVIWGDPDSGLPFHVEITNATNLLPGAKVTLSEFEFNVELDESLFSVKPPAGYEVQEVEMSLSEPTEKDLMETLDRFSALSDGHFPKVFGPRGLQELAKAMGYDKHLPQGELMEQWMALCTKLNRGFLFALSLPAEANATYAGMSATRDAKDQPIFWYKPVGSTKFRIIYADLTVEESDVAPVAENGRPPTMFLGP